MYVDTGVPDKIPGIQRQEVGHTVDDHRCDQPRVVDLDPYHRMNDDQSPPLLMDGRAVYK